MNGRPAVALAYAACAACSLFVDTGEFTSGRDVPPGPNDASVLADVSTEARADDADGGGDAGSGADAAPTPCPDGGFCDSFERTTVKGEWDDILVNLGCTVTLDSTQASGGASSLRSVLVATTADNCQGFLRRTFSGSPKKIRMSAAVRISAMPDREIHFITFEVHVGTAHRALYFNLMPDGLRVAEQEFGGNFYAADEIGAFSPAAWHRLLVEHDVETRSLRAEVDGVERASVATDRTFSGAASFVVTVGNVFARRGAPVDLWIDDYRFEPTY